MVHVFPLYGVRIFTNFCLSKIQEEGDDSDSHSITPNYLDISKHEVFHSETGVGARISSHPSSSELESLLIYVF